MWTRKQLKEKAKYCFKANYWKTLLISVIFLLIAGASSAAGSAGSLSSLGSAGMVSSDVADETEYDDDEIWGTESDDWEYEWSTEEYADYEDLLGEEDDGSSVGSAVAIAGIVLFVLILIFAVAAAVVVLYEFLLSPIEVGARRFFVRNLNEQAEVKEIAYGYDHNYMTNVVTLLLRDVFTFLWSLLFIIPGIVKSYEYSLIPYILADHPEFTRKEAFASSKELMKGNKWRTFVLDLSFIGWRILSMFTFGILNIFYVNPYYNMTRAALYEAIVKEREAKNDAAVI